MLNIFKFSKFFITVQKNNYDDLLNIDGIGETQMKSIKRFFLNNTNKKVLNEFEKILEIKNAKIQNSDDGILSNKTFLVTGKLKELVELKLNL